MENKEKSYVGEGRLRFLNSVGIKTDKSEQPTYFEG